MTEEYHRLISDIYKAGAGLQPWSFPLQRLVDMTNSRHAMLQCFTRRTSPVQLVWACDNGDISPDMLEYYASYTSEFGDPRVEFGAFTSRTFDDLDLVEPRQMLRHPYWMEVLNRLDIRFALCSGFINSFGDRQTGMSLQRSPRQGLPNREERRIFEIAKYHFRQALELREAIDGCTGRAHVEAGTQSICWSVVDGDARLLTMTPDLESLMDEGLTRLKGGRVRFTRARVEIQFLEALTKSAAGSVASVQISRQRRLCVIPLGTSDFFIPANRFAMFLEATEAPDAVTMLRSRFDLTAAEGGVVMLLSEGSSPQQISEQRSTSVATVRTQIKAAYKKMGVGTQREAVSLVAKVVRQAAVQDREADPQFGANEKWRDYLRAQLNANSPGA